jgi:hypothetical protein
MLDISNKLSTIILKNNYCLWGYFFVKNQGSVWIIGQ